jgi:hypothetical protein
MPTKKLIVAVALVGAAAVQAQQAPQSPPAEQQRAAATAAAAPATAPENRAMSGMSILGNQEAPKSLVIVPWKSSEIGSGLGVSRALDTRIRAVDKDVFMRELKYYGIRAGAEK